MNLSSKSPIYELWRKILIYGFFAFKYLWMNCVFKYFPCKWKSTEPLIKFVSILGIAVVPSSHTGPPTWVIIWRTSDEWAKLQNKQDLQENYKINRIYRKGYPEGSYRRHFMPCQKHRHGSLWLPKTPKTKLDYGCWEITGGWSRLRRNQNSR